MKKTFLLVASTLCLLGLASCGDKYPDVTLTPKEASIRGDLGDYFTVVEEPFTLTYEQEYGSCEKEITIKLKRTDKPFAFEKDGMEPVGTWGQNVKGNYGIGIEIYDANDNLVFSRGADAAGLLGVYSHSDLAALLDLKSGETSSVRWSGGEDLRDLEGKEFTYKVTSTLKFNKEEPKTESKSESKSKSLDEVYNEAMDSYNKAYDEAMDSYNKAYDDAMDSYNKALKDASDSYNKAYEDAKSIYSSYY